MEIMAGPLADYKACTVFLAILAGPLVHHNPITVLLLEVILTRPSAHYNNPLITPTFRAERASSLVNYDPFTMSLIRSPLLTGIRRGLPRLHNVNTAPITTPGPAASGRRHVLMDVIRRASTIPRAAAPGRSTPAPKSAVMVMVIVTVITVAPVRPEA